MKEEKLQEIMEQLERSPDMPLLIINDSLALDAIGPVSIRYPGAHLLMMRGMRYITVTDKAVQQILEQLEKERLQSAKVLANYDREISDIRGLIGSGQRYYCSPDSLTQVQDREQKEGMYT